MHRRDHLTRTAKGRAAGFSLIELMVAVAVVAILGGVAYPSYVEYITRSRIIQATTSLSDYRVKMEQFFQDNRRYDDGGGGCGVVPPAPGPSDHFQLVCMAANAAGYTVQAQGLGSMAPAAYQLVVAAGGIARSTATPYAGWSVPVPNNCWAIRKNGSCS